MPKSSAFENDPTLKQYFDSLPPFIQETILQSGVRIENTAQLKACAEKIVEKKNSSHLS